MKQDNILSDLLEVTHRWVRIESLLKKHESISAEIAISSINELRFAGRHISNILHNTLSNKILNENSQDMSAALSCLARAQHDLIDAIIILFGEKLEYIEKTFGLVLVNSQLQNYTEISLTLDKLNKIVVGSTYLRGLRVDIYDKIETEDIDKILNFIKEIEIKERVFVKLATLEAEKYELDKQIREKDDAQLLLAKKTYNAGLISLVVGLSSLVAALIIAYWPFIK